MTDQPTLVNSPELSGIRGLMHFAASPNGAFAEAQRLHGDVVEFRQAGRHYVMFSHPDAIEAVLHNKSALVKDFFTKDLELILGDGLLTAEGEVWRKKRRLVASAFHPHGLGSYVETFVACTDEASLTLKDGDERDVYQDSMHLTLDIVTRSLFGTKMLRFDDVEKALQVVTLEYQRLWQTLRAVLPRWLPLAPLRHLKQARARLDEILLEVIREKRERPSTDLLSRLIALRDENKEGMSDAELLDETMTLFLAGHETTALALTYTLYLLAIHPDAYAQVLAEVDGVLARRTPNEKDAELLPFTSAVVKESLRLYPPVWTMARLSSDGVEVAGVKLQKGDQVITSQWVVQRDARWFKEPESFRPDRWLSGECKDLPRFAYFPFGGGPRVCIGQHFALLELLLVVSRLSQDWVFESEGEAPPELGPVITLRPKDKVLLRVRKRRVPEEAKSGRAAE